MRVTWLGLCALLTVSCGDDSIRSTGSGGSTQVGAGGDPAGGTGGTSYAGGSTGTGGTTATGGSADGDDAARYQDPASGRWYQVVDKGSDSRNWTETSCSSMYSYVTWWAYRHRIVDKSFAAVATKGFNGVMQMVTKDGSNRTTIKQICTGLGATGNVADYYAHSRADNDPHGVGAFVLMWEGMQ